MNVVYTIHRSRLYSIGLDGQEYDQQKEAVLLTQEQTDELLKDHPERQVMSEYDWFSY